MVFSKVVKLVKRRVIGKKLKMEAKPKPKVKVKLRIKAKVKPKVKIKPKIKVKPRVKAKVKPEPKIKPKAKIKAKPMAKAKVKAKKARAEAKAAQLRVTNKIIEELIIGIIGEDVPPLIFLLRNKRNVSEFKLAEKLNLTVNQVRNMLYRLYKHNLVNFVRKKDKKKGWYIYYWTLNVKNVKDVLYNFKKKRLEDFKQRLNNEQSGSFYVCPNACMRLKLEAAMEYEFKCQECGQLMQEQDNTKTIANIKNKIKELEAELGVA